LDADSEGGWIIQLAQSKKNPRLPSCFRARGDVDPSVRDVFEAKVFIAVAAWTVPVAVELLGSETSDAGGCRTLYQVAISGPPVLGIRKGALGTPAAHMP
jgi:hypothetical protein